MKDEALHTQIASELVLSENTIKTHIKNILFKLHLKNRSQAAEYATRLELRIAGPGDVDGGPG